MAVRVSCPSCSAKIRVPEELAGRRVTCPRCEDAVRVPHADPAPADNFSPLPDEPPLTPSARLGAVSLGLGLLAVLVLCVPFVGYASPALSGLGVLLGLGGLFNARRERAPSGPGPHHAGARPG